MTVCPQCKGKGNTDIRNQPLNVPNGVVFTALTQTPEQLCNFCQGNGYFTGAGS